MQIDSTKSYDQSGPKLLGPPDLLVSAVPELSQVLTSDAQSNAQCQTVAGLSYSLEGTSSSLPCLLHENLLLFDPGALANKSRAKRLEMLLQQADSAGWLNCDAATAIELLGDAILDDLRAKVANGATLAERLLLAVGGRTEPLLNALDDLGTKEFVHECSSVQLAALVLSQLGPATLSRLEVTLEEEGLRPPKRRWNSSEARDFVDNINFPPEFATSPETRRESEEVVSGPIALPELHDFQVEVVNGLRVLLESGTGRRRAVVSLPTGGGKTRVTVQAAIDLILTREDRTRIVLWIAQTGELCEQGSSSI